MLDYLFGNRKTGAITIIQAPNLLLWIVIASGAVRAIFLERGTLGHVANAVFHVALSAWAVDEILRGVNPWRRSLGAAVIAYQLVAFLYPDAALSAIHTSSSMTA